MNRFLPGTSIQNEIIRSMQQIIFGATFERFPRLRIVSAENGTGWIPNYLYRADRSCKRNRYVKPIDLTMPPSGYFRCNVWATFIDDPVGLKNIDLIGADNIMWSSDYPHQASTWPPRWRSSSGTSSASGTKTRSSICRDNAAKLDGFDLSI